MDLLRAKNMELKPCPQCGYSDPGIDSSRDLGLSQAQCGNCGYCVQKKVDEDRIPKLWNRLDRSKMPHVTEDPDEPGPFPKLETHPYEYQLRYGNREADMWLPCREPELDRLLADPHFQVRRRSDIFDQKDLLKRQLTTK